MSSPIILVIEDNIEQVELIKDILDEECNVISANNMDESLKLLENNIPAVILLDINIPGGSGFELLKHIRKKAKFRYTKVILISGSCVSDDRVNGYQLGANDFINKPYIIEEFKAKVDSFARLYEMERKQAMENHGLQKKIQDISENLTKSERMAYLGLHAAEVIHNLNNPLATLDIAINQAMKDRPDDLYLKKFKRSSIKLQKIVDSILVTMERDYLNEIKILNVHNIMDQELDLLSLDSFVKHSVQIEKVYEAKSFLNIVPSHIGQIINNLFKNAIEAIKPKGSGKLRVFTKDMGEKIVIEIEDDGVGIPKEICKNVFNPFFTTKTGQGLSLVKGTGLGLSYCRDMAHSYGGEVSFDSSSGKGTKFTLILPSVARASQAS